MKYIIIAVITTFMTFGCKSYIQVFNTNSSIPLVDKGFYVYENDSVKITYSFWKEKGLMTFSIFNKLNKPLYIDWKKSSYIDNSVKLNYWVDEEKNKTLGAYEIYSYNGPLLKPGYAVSSSEGASVSTTVKIERITFIPPSSNYFRSQFYILPINFFKLDIKTEFTEIPRNDKPQKKTKVYSLSFTKEISPLIFRNFLTFSLTEDFKSEFYVDNEFYISEIKEMDKRHFESYHYYETPKGKQVITNENGNPILFPNFKKESSFYLKISKKGSIEHRK